MPEDPQQPQQQRVVAHMTITVEGFNQLVDQLTNLPYREAAPIINLLTKEARAVFQDQLAKIVDKPPEDPPDGTNRDGTLDNQNEGGA